MPPCREPFCVCREKNSLNMFLINFHELAKLLSLAPLRFYSGLPNCFESSNHFTCDAAETHINFGASCWNAFSQNVIQTLPQLSPLLLLEPFNYSIIYCFKLISCACLCFMFLIKLRFFLMLALLLHHCVLHFYCLKPRWFEGDCMKNSFVILSWSRSRTYRAGKSTPNVFQLSRRGCR